MKCKLLKRIRKQYEIFYYPNNMPFYDELYIGEYVRVLDNNNEYRVAHFQITDELSKEDAIAAAKEQILIWFRKEYGHNKSKRARAKKQKVWYKSIKN